MSIRKAEDFRRMTDEELETAEVQLREGLFQLRFQQHTAQLSNTAELSWKRRELARLITVKRERELGPSAEPQAADATEG